MIEKDSESESGQKDDSFHTIDQFRQSPLQNYKKYNKFPWRPSLNIMLILLSTFQIYLIVNSRVYLRGQLVRTFLSVYFNENEYENVFDGLEFYVKMKNIQQLSQQLVYTFDKMNKIDEDSFIDINYGQSKIYLQVEYKKESKNQKKKTLYEIDPTEGITNPFDMKNITDIQHFLLSIQRFHLKVENLTVKQNWEGFTQKYKHEIIYYYINSICMEINFLFSIDNALVSEEQDCVTEQWKQQSYNTIYIIKIRIFYAIIIVLASASLYLNYLSIRRTYQILYEELGQKTEKQNYIEVYGQNDQDAENIKKQIKTWVKMNRMSMKKIKVQHYLHILQFDVIFSTLSNMFQIIAGFYLISGIEKQRFAGIACLFSWLTVFKFIRQYKKLILMYELIKLSLLKVINFFIEFLPVFLSYALLGLCLFPKVSFFSSMSDSVTTLVCLMMGDSIEMITRGIIQKNSTILGIIYIFSFVLLFMHAIHNTLTSLIKEFFIIKKIQLVRQEKEKKKEKYLTIQEIGTQTQKEKQNLPLKMSTQLQLYVFKSINKKIFQVIFSKIQHLIKEIQILQLYEIEYRESQNKNVKKSELKKIKEKKERIINTIKRFTTNYQNE